MPPRMTTLGWKMSRAALVLGLCMMMLIGCAGTQKRSTFGGEHQTLTEALEEADGNFFAINALHVTLPIDEQKQRIDGMSDVPPVLREWAKTTLAALESQDGELLLSQIDVHALALRGVPEGMPMGSRGFLAAALRPAVKEWVQQIVKLDGAVTFRGFARLGDDLLLRYRLTGEEGYFYVHFVFPESAIKPVDVYLATLGHHMSEAIAHGAALGIDAQATGHLEALTQMNAKMEAPAAYLKAYDALPAGLQKSWLLRLKAVWIGQALSDEAYLSRMEAFINRFPDHPATALVSFDFYFMKEDYKKAMEAALKAEQQVGGDAWLLSLAAMCAYADNDTARVQSLLSQAHQLEPDAAFVAFFHALLEV